MNSHEPIVVIGGTRGTGLLIARLLHRQGQCVRVLARDRAWALTLFDRSVQVVDGDVTKTNTLGLAIRGARHIIFTAGCRSGYSIQELRELAEDLGASNYQWDFGELKGTVGPIPITYLIGVPMDRTA